MGLSKTITRQWSFHANKKTDSALASPAKENENHVGGIAGEPESPVLASMLLFYGILLHWKSPVFA